jgi:hypothetical protein
VGVSCYWFGAGVIWVVLSKVDLEQWGMGYGDLFRNRNVSWLYGFINQIGSSTA